ncbi:MAG: hypothetical protein HOQ22_17625 [Nocardioidaceae bacterium]|nr:hypothetical protein [Nocardioidaceae bacterium]NUS52845.1 hypothetical protein [Nocardioidaceae bacterium]
MSAVTLDRPEPAPLTSADRCDRCGVRACVRIELSHGAELLFCAHHARAHVERLREVAVRIHDEAGVLAR